MQFTWTWRIRGISWNQTGECFTFYDRSYKNREAVIRIHGTKCMICGFDFEQKYGELGKGYIEVHNIKPLATLEQEVVVNLETDLICVCANYHRMLHG